MFARVQPVCVTKEDLQRHQHGHQPQRHRHHGSAFLDEPPAPQKIGADPQHDEAGGDKKADHRVPEPEGKRWIEDDLQPILRKEAAIDEFITGRRLHPAVRRQYPERREQRAERNHQGCDEMRPGRHQLAPKQQYAEKRRFKEECRQTLIGKQRGEYVRGGVRIAAPVSAELEGHDDTGHDAHAECDRKNLDPEHRDAKVDIPPGKETEPLEHGDERRHADGECREQDVPPDYPGKLQPRQENGIKLHRSLPALINVDQIAPLHDAAARAGVPTSWSADSRMATSCSTVPPLTPTPATIWPSLVSGAPPPIEQYLPSDSPIRGNSACPGCTSGERSAVRSPTSADV